MTPSLFRPLISATALVAAAPVMAQTAPIAPVDSREPAIVVTGMRLSDSEKALKDCIARRCPPDQDIAATLTHAENQFVAGGYKAARGTLIASIKRNRRYARKLPVDVSYLLRANARVAEHLGEGQAYRLSTFDMVSALKEGLPDDDPRVLLAELERADIFARFGEPESSEAGYRSVLRRAEDRDLVTVKGYALLRIVALYFHLAELDRTEFGSRARKAIDAIVKDPDPRLKPFAQAATVLGARLNAKAGDNRAVDELIANYRSEKTGLVPALLYAPSVDFQGTSAAQGGSANVRNRRPTVSVDNQWIDVSFFVGADGRVTDVGVLRQSDSLDGFWVKPVIAAISERRYAPLPIAKDSPGIFRVERYTLTSRFEQSTESRIRSRGPTLRIETLDLSVDPPAPAASSG